MMNRIWIAVGVFTVLSLFHSSAQAQQSSCVQSSNSGWMNRPIATQTAQFTATYDATPNDTDIDGVIGFSLNAISGYTNLATATRFNSDGMIDARNGNVYSANVAISYSAGLSYHFRLAINPATEHYSIYVTPPGQSEVALGTNYAFRSEQSTISSLNNWTTLADTGGVTICNMVIVSNAGPQPTGSSTLTLGRTTVGTITDSADSNFMNLVRVVAGAQNGMVSECSVNVGPVDAAPANQWQCALYSDSGGNVGTLIAASSSGTLMANGWNTAALTATIAANTAYWIGYNSNGSATMNNFKYDSVASTVFQYQGQTYGTWPASPSTSGPLTVQPSLYITYTGRTAVPTTAMPTLGPAAGTFTSSMSVTISDATPGAVIYYTTNGSTPTTSSNIYKSPIAVNSTTTIQAMAASSGNTNSAVASATYTIGSGTRLLSANPSSLTFGNVNVGGNSLLASTLTNSGSSNVTISKVSIVGAGVTVTGVSVGQMIPPGQTVPVSVLFAPSITGSITGSATVTSDATNSPTKISLSGIGVQLSTHATTLSWKASTSQGIGAYNVYSGAASGGPYSKLTATPVSAITYKDSTVQSGKTYFYVVTAVDSSGAESAFSNQTSADIP